MFINVQFFVLTLQLHITKSMKMDANILSDVD